MKRAWNYRLLAVISSATIAVDVGIWSQRRTAPALLDVVAVPFVGLVIALIAWHKDATRISAARCTQIVALLHDRGPLSSRQLQAFLVVQDRGVTIFDVFLEVHTLRRRGLLNSYGTYRLHSLTDAGFDAANVDPSPVTGYGRTP